MAYIGWGMEWRAKFIAQNGVMAWVKLKNQPGRAVLVS